MNIICQNKDISNHCEREFMLDQFDLDLLTKLKVPNPTFCPTCSHQRRFAWRNTHALYHRPDSVTGNDLISIYHPDVAMNVVDQKYWWSDSWDPFDYGRDFDFTRDFFSQWRDLRNVIPFQALSNSKAVNSDYCNVNEESVDCYLISSSWKNERVQYSDSIKDCKDSMDLYVSQKLEYSFESIYSNESNKIFYCEKTYNSTNSYFLYDCKGCVDCFMSTNLRNKSYVFNNQQLSKEEYQKKFSELNLGSYAQIQKLKNDFEELKQKSIHKFATIVNSYNVTGNNILNAKDSYNCFDFFQEPQNCKDCFWGGVKAHTMYRCGPGMGLGENFYESFDGAVNGNHNICTSVVYTSNNVEYSFNCYNSHDLFGCIGLRNKSYCILNKQYIKEEYFELLPKIKQHMMDMPYIDKKGRVYKYGEFFPIELSPFAYNETVAHNFFPLSQGEVSQHGYMWRNPTEKNYTHTKTKDTLPDDIQDVDQSILNDIIECSDKRTNDRCATAFKITEREFEFYKRFTIPLPRQCYQCRHKTRFAKRNPLHLWTRMCMNPNSPVYDGPCQNSFQTSYAPERKEKVYCDDCYKREVL